MMTKILRLVELTFKKVLLNEKKWLLERSFGTSFMQIFSCLYYQIIYLIVISRSIWN